MLEKKLNNESDSSSFLVYLAPDIKEKKKKKGSSLRPFSLEMEAEVNGRFLKGKIFSPKDLQVVSKVPSNLCLDSIRYAACRVFAKSKALQEAILPKSFVRRVDPKKYSRITHECVKVPSFLFDVSGADVYIGFAIKAEGVVIEKVWILPEGARSPRNDFFELNVANSPHLVRCA